MDISHQLALDVVLEDVVPRFQVLAQSKKELLAARMMDERIVLVP